MRFYVEQFKDGEWSRVPFAESNTVQYCHGFVDAMDSVYPSSPFRICKRDPTGGFKVLRETNGRSAPSV